MKKIVTIIAITLFAWIFCKIASDADDSVTIVGIER